MKCIIKTISPVHIGNGREYGPSEFYHTQVEKTPVVARIDVNTFYSQLSDDRKDEFLEHLTDPSFKLQDYLLNVLKTVPEGITKYMSIKMSKNIVNINEHIKTMGELYIPGSSIKGAIKTALMYEKFSNKDIHSLKRIIKETNRGNFNVSRGDYQNFERQFFSSDGKNASYHNIMKFLQISDTSTLKVPHIHGLATMKVKESGGAEWHKVHGHIMITHAETIERGRILECEIGSNINPIIFEKLGLSDKKDMIEMEKIKSSIYNFSADYIDFELNFAQKYGLNFLEKFYEDLMDLNTLKKPLLRIGFGSGFLSTTIGLKVREADPETYERIRRTFRRAYHYEFPKSRKLTEKKMPLGWIQLDF